MIETISRHDNMMCNNTSDDNSKDGFNASEATHLISEDVESQSIPVDDSVRSPLRPTRAQTIQVIKYGYSLLLLGLCVQSVTVGMFKAVTPISRAASPIAAFAIMWSLILWLGVLEGGQGSLVGLQPICSDDYEHTHSHSFRCTKLAHEGNNINRFIVGRQFFVVLVIFVVNLCCTVVDGAENVSELSATTLVFLESGIAVMIITVILGQLSAEVNATHCMLDFINTPIMYVTTWMCLAIESSGLLHSVYIVPKIIRWFSSGATNETSDDVQKSQSGWSFWIRVAFSMFIVTYAMVVTFVALWEDETTMYRGIPNGLNILIFIFLIMFLGMLEAMQIALFAVVKLPESDLHGHPRALSNYRLSFSGTNFQAFLIGRQICVTVCMFLLARITTTEVDTDQQHVSTILFMPLGLQEFFNTGLPGAIITTVVASLMWRIVASTFPIAFMNNPLVYPTIRTCLLLEDSGVFSASWLLAKAVKASLRLKEDDLYLQERQGVPNKNKFARQETESLSDTTDDDDDYASLSFYGSTSASSSF